MARQAEERACERALRGIAPWLRASFSDGWLRGTGDTPCSLVKPEPPAPPFVRERGPYLFQRSTNARAP